MVSTNELLLLGGGVLAAFFLSKRQNGNTTIPANDYYEQVQAVDLQRLSEFDDRITQLKDIRTQILDYEKGIANQQVSYLESEIGKASAAGSAAQQILAKYIPSNPKLGYGLGFITQKTASYIKEAGGDLQIAFNKLINIGDYQRAQIIANLAEQEANREILAASNQFISQAQQQQADIMAKYNELEQIV